MDGSCSSSWAVGPAMPGDSPRLKAQGGCVGPSPGAVVYNSTPTSMDRPKDQGQFKRLAVNILALKQRLAKEANKLNLALSPLLMLCTQ